MAGRIIPEKTINFNLFVDNNPTPVAVTTVAIGNVGYMSDTISGAGIAGEYTSPVVGHTQSIDVTLSFNSITKDFYNVWQPGSHKFQLRAALQESDSSTGRQVNVSHAIHFTARLTGAEFGTFQVGTPLGSSISLSTEMIACYHDNKETLFIDKKNMVHRVHGFDSLAEIRELIS